MSSDLNLTTDEYRPVVLKVMADGREHGVREICDAVADEVNLPASVREERIASGERRHVNRIQWAMSGLTVGGLLERPKRGRYRITTDGRMVAARNLTVYTEKQMLEWPAWQEYQAEIAARNRAKARAAAAGDEHGEDAEGAALEGLAKDSAVDPVEAIEEAERNFNSNIETKLRQRLQAASPEFFERAVIELLWAMGYGGAHGEKQHVGRSNDGGIDGVIRQDALGLTNVYIQAKRYADTNRVGDPEIRNFIGSLDSRGASLGVFITTSTFLPKAVETAERYRHGKIVLIDGMKLTTLMLDYGVAVHKHREFTLYDIDDDFFDEDLA